MTMTSNALSPNDQTTETRITKKHRLALPALLVLTAFLMGAVALRVTVALNHLI